MIELPLNHYRHLMRLADLRRCPVPKAVDYLFAAVEPNPKNWIDERLGPCDEVRRVDVSGCTAEKVMDRIQGLPPNIRPVTDGPYLDRFEFFSGEAGLLGIEAEGMKLLDFERATSRDRAVFALVKDLLPPMSFEEYRIYNTFNSQYLRLVREPDLFTMPRNKTPAVDVGCYVGYKAFALGQFVGEEEVLAFEMVDENIHVLQLNVSNNPHIRVRPIQAALSDARKKLATDTNNERSMAHSLVQFSTLKEANVSLGSGAKARPPGKVVQAEPLDHFTRSYKAFSAVHISVNGYEPEVVAGATETLRKSDIIRVSCPYKRDDQPLFKIVSRMLAAGGISVFGRSGGAVVAGTALGSYHAQPMND